MGFNRVVTPSLPCPYCGMIYSVHLSDAAWMDGQGANPEKTVLELHMTECDRKDDPIATGFVEASEILGNTNATLGLAEPREESEPVTLIPQE